MTGCNILTESAYWHAVSFIWLFSFLQPNSTILRTVQEMFEMYSPTCWQLALNLASLTLWIWGMSWEVKIYKQLEAHKEGNVEAQLHVSAGYLVYIVFGSYLLVAIVQAIGSKFPALYTLRIVGPILGTVFRMAMRIWDTDFFALVPTTLNILAISSGYYAHLYYVVVTHRGHEVDPIQWFWYASFILQLAGALCIICIDYQRHKIIYHQNFIDRQIFKEKFLRFLPDNPEPLDSEQQRQRDRAAERKRLGIAVTWSEWPGFFADSNDEK